MSIEHAHHREKRGNRRSGGTRFLSAHDLADLLGCHVATVWRHVSAGKLPKPIRIGGLTRWPSEDLDAAIARAKAEREAA